MLTNQTISYLSRTSIRSNSLFYTTRKVVLIRPLSTISLILYLDLLLLCLGWFHILPTNRKQKYRLSLSKRGFASHSVPSMLSSTKQTQKDARTRTRSIINIFLAPWLKILWQTHQNVEQTWKNNFCWFFDDQKWFWMPCRQARWLRLMKEALLID